jgi:3',5'-cyclic-AMP phosphodiesterase
MLENPRYRRLQVLLRLKTLISRWAERKGRFVWRIQIVASKGAIVVFDTTRNKLSRRDVLKAGLAFAAGVTTLGPGRLLADARNDCVRWAFLSDTHIASTPDRRCRGFYPYLNLQEIVAHIESDLPDGLVITGDLARRNGRIKAYDNLKTLLAPISGKRPVCLGIGNHDDRDDFFQAFVDRAVEERPVENRHIVVVDAGPVRFLVLDTLYHVNWLAGWLARSLATGLAGDSSPRV